MSIQSEIERISQAKTDIHSAIESKGVTVPDDTLISEMAPYIQQIREAGTVVTSVSYIKPDENGNVQLENLRIYCGEQNVTYDGGAEQYLTINTEAIGAATAEQGALAETAVQPAQIADFITEDDIPSSLPNPQSLTIKLNGSAQQSYDGSTARTVDVTPSSIGAATSAQGALAQTAVQPAQIADFITAEDIPDELPNPYSLGIQLNGGSTTAYDGSATRNVNITAAAIGAATSSDLEALEPLVGTTSNTTPLQVYNALSDGRQCFITDSSTYVTYTSWSYNGTTTNGNVHGVSIYINSGKIVSSSLGGAVSSSGGSWNRGNTSGLLYTGNYRSSNTQFLTATVSDGLVLEDISSIIDGEIPSSLPNPNNLIIRQNNGVGTSYNGQTQVTINITASSVGAAPTMHSVTDTTYGVGTQSYYGHVRLSDSITDTSSTSSGCAATPYAVKQVNDNMPVTHKVNLIVASWHGNGTGDKYWRQNVGFDGITSSYEVISITQAPYDSSDETISDSEKKAAATWTYVETGPDRLSFYSKEKPTYHFSLIVTCKYLD